MPQNLLGNYIRERRQDLGLTQEELAERIGGSASQAEISRLERGTILFPRRSRLDGLAVALEVSLGTLLVNSGWLDSDQGTTLDAVPIPQTQHDPSTTEAMMTEVVQLREILLTAIQRLGDLEESIKTSKSPSGRPEVNVPTGIFDDWESSDMFPL